jgi:ATP-dependent Lon protease
MTGEVTLRGRVLPVGGVREKVLAAHRAGLKTVILPKRNAKDLVEIPKRARAELNLVMVEHMDEVLGVALAKEVAPPKRPRKARQPKPVESSSAEDLDPAAIADMSG